MPRLTKRQALEECVILWKAIALKSKNTSYYGLTEKGAMSLKRDVIDNVLPKTRYQSDCPCCEYAQQHDINCEYDDGDSKTSRCIIPNWSEYEVVQGHYACLNEDSPYYLWCYSKSKAKRKQKALKIVELAKEALADLEGA